LRVRHRGTRDDPSNVHDERGEPIMSRTVPAVVRAMDILELFLDVDAELSPRDFAARLGLPRTTVFELLNTLVSRGYLTRTGEDSSRYRLGVRVFQLGSAYSERLDLAREGRRVAGEVARLCDETVHVAVLDGSDVVYIAKVDSTRSVRMVSAVGRRLPAHCSAVGKMLLAGLPSSAVRARLPQNRPLPALTPRTLTSVRKLERELERIRAEGVAFEHGESNDDVSCVSAPVYDHGGSMVAAMSISVPSSRWDHKSDIEWAQLVTDGAAQLSRELGHVASAGRLPTGT
jgi:IclR family transcriptional regulator, KDG regulon repressor